MTGHLSRFDIRLRVTPCGSARLLSRAEILSLSLPTLKVTSCRRAFGTEKRYISTLCTSRARRIMSGLEVLERKSNSDEAAAAIEVVIKHSGVENRIIGSPETVLRELLSYFSKVYPSIDLVSKLVLSVSPEGLVVLKDLRELKDKELMMIHLAGSRLQHQMGKKESDTLSLDEITKTTGRSTGQTFVAVALKCIARVEGVGLVKFAYSAASRTMPV